MCCLDRLNPPLGAVIEIWRPVTAGVSTSHSIVRGTADRNTFRTGSWQLRAIAAACLLIENVADAVKFGNPVKHMRPSGVIGETE